MKNIGIKLAAVAFLLGAAAAPAVAGRGGSAANIKAAVASTSVDAIIAEVERSEHLSCGECLDVMTRLTADSRYPVREVAAWWFTKRPAMLRILQDQFNTELVNGTSVEVRNAADFLGASTSFKSLPQFRTAIRRELNVEAKLAIVRAVKVIANIGGNDVLAVAMTDADPKVRAAAVTAWRDIRNQPDAAPAIGLLADPDAAVRADAATVVGAMAYTNKVSGAVTALEGLAVNDASPMVRKNAAWALGKIGSASSRTALSIASNDKSGYVRMTARAALTQLH